MINYFSEEPEYSSWDEYTRKLAEDAVHQVLTRKNPNAKALRTVRRNLGLPNEYLEFKPKEPEQYNLPEFKSSTQADYFKEENLFKSPPMPSFSNWEEYSEWLLKDLQKNVELPEGTKPTNLQVLKKYYDQPYRKPEFKPAPPQPVKPPPEFKPLFLPKEKKLLFRLWVLYNYVRDNVDDRSVRGVNELYNLGKIPFQMTRGNWPPKYDENNPGFISHKDVRAITFDDYLDEIINGGDPSKRYAKWSDIDPVYSIRPKTKAGTFVKGYLTRRMDRHLPSDLLINLLPAKLTILKKLNKIKESIEQAQDLMGAYDDVKKFDQDQK